MFHDLGIRARKAVVVATTPTAASTSAASGAIGSYSGELLAQIWLTISVSLKPQSQDALSIVAASRR